MGVLRRAAAAFLVSTPALLPLPLAAPLSAPLAAEPSSQPAAPQPSSQSAAPRPSSRSAAPRPGVVAADHDAFWVWGGIARSPLLATARSVYVLQGEVHRDRRRGEVRVIAQGPSTVPRIAAGEAWLVYRADTLDWPEPVYRVLLAQLARWRAAGNPVTGLQVDFDSATRGLSGYAAFLRELRRRLPADYRLSITGLMDWGRNAAPEDLDRLASVVDEVVIQTYQGRRTIPGYMAYMPRIARLKLPFKIGLVEGGDWLEPPGLAANPWFRGYVVFLTERAPARRPGAIQDRRGAPTDGRLVGYL